MRILLLIVLSVGLAGCWFEPITWETPPATENFIRFRIDGREFESYRPFLFGMPPEAWLDTTQGWVNAKLSAPFEDKDTTVGWISIYLPSFEPGTYSLTDTLAPGSSGPYSAATFEIGSKHTKSREYQVMPASPGVVTITQFDTAAKVLKGTFTLTGELTGTPPPGNWPKQITLTDGVFDFRENALILWK